MMIILLQLVSFHVQPSSGAWETFAIDQMWLFVPLQQSIKEFLVTIPQYPFQMGSSLTVSGINYDYFIGSTGYFFIIAATFFGIPFSLFLGSSFTLLVPIDCQISF